MNEAESARNEEFEKQTTPKPTAAFSASDPDSFTQIFGALKKKKVAVQQKGNQPESNHYRDTADLSDAQYTDRSEFTQLFERSNERGTNAMPKETTEPTPFKRKGGEGEFTQLLGRVSREGHAAEMPLSAPALNAHLRAGGPSEFTQIISQSMLREAGNQGAQEHLGKPSNRSETQQPAPLPVSPPDNTDQRQAQQNMDSGSAPSINPQAMLSGIREASRLAGNGGSLNSRVADHVASAISSRSSATSTPPPASRRTFDNRLQEHVPLLLIANLFLTLLLLILVGFALLHRP